MPRPGRDKNIASHTQKATLASLAREHTADALKEIVEIMKDKEVDAGVRLDAAAMVLDRGYGKPISPKPDPASVNFYRYDLTRLKDSDLDALESIQRRLTGPDA